MRKRNEKLMRSIRYPSRQRPTSLERKFLRQQATLSAVMSVSSFVTALTLAAYATPFSVVLSVAVLVFSVFMLYVFIEEREEMKKF